MSRADQRPTGIDRIERAYIQHLAQDPAPLFGLVRTKLGYLLLDREGCTQLLAHCDDPIWQDTDVLSRLSRRGTPARAITESGLRKVALDRATPARLKRMLKRHVPAGTMYFNVGQTNFNDRVVRTLQALDDVRIAVYVHDTIPLDFPETQTQKSRLRFRRYFERVDRFADLVLCNSKHTKECVLGHARHVRSEAVHVATPGLPKMTLGQAPVGAWTGNPYFVTIGTIEPRKNIDFLLDLWEDLAGSDDPKLLICGRRGWLNESVFNRLDTGQANVHELNDLTDDALWALLGQSNGLLFPSLAEGFGYPAMEAAHLNVPVVCTPLAVLKSTLGDYPIYAGESERYLWLKNIEQLAQRRRDQSGEQTKQGAVQAPGWQAHFNQLFTYL